MAMKETNTVKIVLENAAGQKNVIGSTFEDLRDIINLVENKQRVCFMNLEETFSRLAFVWILVICLRRVGCLMLASDALKDTTFVPLPCSRR